MWDAAFEFASRIPTAKEVATRAVGPAAHADNSMLIVGSLARLRTLVSEAGAVQTGIWCPRVFTR